MTRRIFVPTAAAAPLAMSAARKGRLKQSVCRWCYKDIPLDDLAREAAHIVEHLTTQHQAIRFGSPARAFAPWPAAI